MTNIKPIHFDSGLNFRMSTTEKEMLAALSISFGMNASTLLRHLIRREFATLEKIDKKM